MKILVIQMKMIGDVLTSSILFEALRKKNQDAELHYLVYEHTKPVVENNPNMDRFLYFRPEEHKSFSGLLRLGRQIQSEKYDAVVDVYSKINSAILTKQSKAPIRIGYQKWYTRSVYTHTFPYKAEAETEAGLAIENRMQLLKPLGDFPVEIKPKIYITKEERSIAKNTLVSQGIDLNRKLIMIGILGSGESKTYPKEYMAGMLDTITENSDAQLLLNYIPKQKEELMEIYKLCSEKTRNQINLDIFGKSLREFMALCSFCDALIGNEGGAVNMAKALDVPTFSVFAPQTPKKDWAIYDDGVENVSVHLSEHQPELIEGKSKKELRKEALPLYQKFQPQLFEAKLIQFLERIGSKTSSRT